MHQKDKLTTKLTSNPLYYRDMVFYKPTDPYELKECRHYVFKVFGSVPYFLHRQTVGRPPVHRRTCEAQW